MVEKQFIIDEAARLAVLNPDLRQVLWFDIDLVELGLFNRCYGRDKGNTLLNSLEEFLNGIPDVQMVVRVEAGRFIFDAITQEVLSDKEVVNQWKAVIGTFITEQQKLYPDFCIRISAGICSMASTSDPFEAVENAMLARKESRKNKAYKPVFYTGDLLDELNLRQRNEMEIRQALNDDRFLYYLQPIVDLHNGKIVGAEALARCIAPNGEVIMPISFLPIMEENGSIVDLDLLILTKVCKCLRERMDKGLPVVCTSINLSRAHLEDDSTAETLLSIANEYNISPDLLNFELTETLPLDEFSKAKILIDQLRERGFRVSIDDYGSGYTGITVWQDLDFDILKMDKKFLSDDPTIKRRNNVLITNTVELAKKMQINIVCEGVERDDQCRSLLDWGCNIAQGYFFSRPIPVDDFYRQYEVSGGYYPIKFK